MFVSARRDFCTAQGLIAALRQDVESCKEQVLELSGQLGTLRKRGEEVNFVRY